MLHEFRVRIGIRVHNFARKVDHGRTGRSSNNHLCQVVLRERPVPVDASIVAKQLSRTFESLPAPAQTVPQFFGLSQVLRTPVCLFIRPATPTVTVSLPAGLK